MIEINMLHKVQDAKFEVSHDAINWFKIERGIDPFHYPFRREVKVNSPDKYKEKNINYVKFTQQLRVLAHSYLMKNNNIYNFNLSQEEIDALLKEIGDSMFKADSSPKFIDYDAIDKINDHNETMNNGKCTCGAAATFGSNATHSTWCDKK